MTTVISMVISYGMKWSSGMKQDITGIQVHIQSTWGCRTGGCVGNIDMV